MQHCGHLLGKGWPLGFLVCSVLLCFVTFPCGILGLVWRLIVSISDICLLTQINKSSLSAKDVRVSIVVSEFLSGFVS